MVINTAIARKRRKQKMESHRFTVSDTDSSSCREQEEEPAKRRRLDENARRKYQNRYEPEVPMTKEELAEWRREARKKRNRESAAASEIVPGPAFETSTSMAIMYSSAMLLINPRPMTATLA